MTSLVVPVHAGGRVVVDGRVLDDCHAIVARGDEEGLYVVGSHVRILADLARVVGVSVRTLEYAFRDVVGMGPLAYVRIQRLNQARRCLLEIRSGRVTVSEVALDHGFGHFGYFARDYKTLFGELPSETLARSTPRAA
jgi:AraC-like DNA-binding protein